MATGNLLLQNIGDGTTANPQLQFIENFKNKDGAAYVAYSNGTLSIQAVNIPLSLSFNYPAVLMSVSSAALSALSATVQLGLYSLNGSTLSLANSASNTIQHTNSANFWYSMVTSTTQNITPGTWYFGINLFTGGIATDHSSASFFGNSSINPGNAIPTLLMARMTASTNAIPASIATSDLDITGSDIIRQPYVIITA